MNLGGLSLTSVTVIFKGTEVVRELGATSLAIGERKKKFILMHKTTTRCPKFCLHFVCFINDVYKQRFHLTS